MRSTSIFGEGLRGYYGGHGQKRKQVDVTLITENWQKESPVCKGNPLFVKQKSENYKMKSHRIPCITPEIFVNDLTPYVLTYFYLCTYLLTYSLTYVRPLIVYKHLYSGIYDWPWSVHFIYVSDRYTLCTGGISLETKSVYYKEPLLLPWICSVNERD